MIDRKQELQSLLDKVEAGTARREDFRRAGLMKVSTLNMCGAAQSGDINSAVGLIAHLFPGWWWSIGTCKVSDDARISPEGDASIRNGKEWSEITDVDLRPPGNPARALLMSGLIALIELEGGEDE